MRGAWVVTVRCGHRCRSCTMSFKRWVIYLCFVPQSWSVLFCYKYVPFTLRSEPIFWHLFWNLCQGLDRQSEVKKVVTVAMWQDFLKKISWKRVSDWNGHSNLNTRCHSLWKLLSKMDLDSSKNSITWLFLSLSPWLSLRGELLRFHFKISTNKISK